MSNLFFTKINKTGPRIWMSSVKIGKFHISFRGMIKHNNIISKVNDCHVSYWKVRRSSSVFVFISVDQLMDEFSSFIRYSMVRVELDWIAFAKDVAFI